MGRIKVATMEKEKPTVRLNFPEKGKVQPKGFKDVSVDEEVTLTIKGKVTRLEHSADVWDKGKHITVQITSCEMSGKAKPVSFSAAIKGARSKI